MTSADTIMPAGSGHFLFCANDHYAQHMAACIASLLENSSLPFHDICVAGNFSDPDVARKLAELIAGYENAALRVIEFSPSSNINLPTRMHWTVDTFSRFWATDFFGPTVERVLYLDSDMIILRDIAELWHADLGGKLFGAVSIPGAERNPDLKIPAEYGYFNAGVLLFDMNRWREETPLETLLPYIEANIDALPYLDQDALNACYHKDRQPLDYRWNMIVPFTWPQSFIPLSAEERAQIVKEAGIAHYNGQSKPWHYMNKHPYKHAYWHYVRKTPWRAAEESGRTPLNQLKKLVDYLLPHQLRQWLWKIRGRSAG